MAHGEVLWITYTSKSRVWMHVTEVLTDRCMCELVNKKNRTKQLGPPNLYVKIVFANLSKPALLISLFCPKIWAWNMRAGLKKEKKVQLSCANGTWYLGGSTPHQLPALPIPHLSLQFCCWKGSSPFTPQLLFSLWNFLDDRVSNSEDGEATHACLWYLWGLWWSLLPQLSTAWG